ncbi:MAG: hypothetical protein JWP89_2887 [Schlesneria sp.]|nr:hypothetical protein [Schlesneria sp.]
MSHQRMTCRLMMPVSHGTRPVVQRWLAICGAALWLVLLAVQSATAQPVDLVTELTEGRRIFVPAEELDVVVEHDRRGVMLTRKKFDELIGLAKTNAKTRPNLPIVLTSSNYQARVSGDQLLMTVTAELSQFVGDWQTTIFPTQRLSIEKATLDDQPAMLGRNQDGSLSLFSNEAGKHVLKLELSTELTSQGSDQVAAFSLLRAPSGTLSLTLPAGKRLLVGALQLERPAPLDKPADYTVAIGGAPGIQLRVTDRAAENAADALTFATTGYGLHVAPGEVTWHALTNLQVFGKPVDRLSFSVPSKLEIADVESTGLESWDLTDDPNDKGRTNIALTFGQAFDGTRKISFKGVMAIETGKPWTVPPLTIANVTSHIGQVLVQHPADVRLRVEETEGVRRATQGQKPTADMPDDMSKFNATEFLRFDVWQPDFVLRLTTQPKQREVQTAVAAVLDVNATGLDLQVIITVKTQFAPLFELDVRLPADWNVISAERDKAALKWQILSQEPGVNQLRILLDPPLAAEGTGTIHLVLRREVEGWPVESTPITVAIPELFLPQSSLNEGTIVIRGDDDLDLAASELKGLDTVPLSADFERLRFRTQDTRYGGQLKVTRKPSRISAQTITVGRLDPQTMHAFVQAMVEVQGGGVRTLRVSLPESAGTAIRFQSPDRQIIEQKPGAIQAGDRIWTLQFDQRSRGVVPLFCDIDLPRGAAKEFVVPQLRFIDAERQNGFQAIEAGGEQRITIDAKAADGTPLVEVDPLDLPNLYYAPKERIVAVYRNATAGAKVTLTEERFDKLPVPSAVCPVLSVTSVLGRTGELQHRATFQLIAVGVQGLRVILPKETVLWATLVDGQPVEVRRQGDIYLVPLNASAAVPTPQGGPHVGQSRQLQLFYRSDVPALTRFGTFEQAPPELSVQTGQGTSQPVDVLDQHWQLNYPSKTLLISSSGPLEPEQHLDETSILGRLNTGVRVPTVSELGWQIFAVIVTLGAIALLMLAYRKGQGTVVASVALLLLLGVGYFGFVYSIASKERSNASYYSEMVEDAYVKEERYDKGAVLDPMASDSTGLPIQVDPDSPVVLPQAGLQSHTVRNRTPQKSGEKFRIEPSDTPPRRKGLATGLADLPRGEPPAADNAPQEPQQQWKDNLDVAQQADEKKADEKRIPRDKLADPALPASKERLGLLSLAIDLTPPEGSLQKTFRYAGSDPARGGIALNLGYVDERSGATVRVFLVALVGLIGWFLRRSSCITKATIAALGLTLPLALLPLVPQGLQVVLDGLFFGIIVACGLWLLVAIARCVETCCVTCCGWTPGNRPTKSGPVIGACVAALLLFGADASAQPNAQPNEPAQQAAVPVRPEGTLIVPFDAGTDPLAADKILLPYEKFVELYRQAYPNKPLNGTAPVDGGIVAAFYSAKVVANEKTPDDSTVEVTARYAIRSYVDGQLQVELPIGAVAARDAKLDGKNAALIVNGVCTKVAISSPGLHVLDFVFSVSARLSGTTGAVTVPLLPVPTGKLSFTLPSKDLSVRINGSSTIFRRVTTGDVQSIEVPVDKGGDLTIAWQPEQAKGAAAAVVHVDSVQAITLTDAGIRVSTGFQYRVRQGGVADVTLSLPATYRLQAVNGSDVGGWELQGEGDARKLRVIFRRNVSDATQLTVEAFLDTRVGTEAVVVDLPQLAPLEVTNEIGQVAVFAGNQFTLRAEKVESLSQIDADKFTTSVPVSRPNVAPQLAYRFSKRPFTLSLRVTRQESQANVTAQQAAFVMQRKQQLTTRLVYNLTGAPRSSFNIALPAGYVVLDVKATGLHDWSLGKQDDKTTLTIDLDGPRLGIAEVVLSGTVPRENATTAAEVVFPHPTDATKLNSMAAVWLDEGFTGTLDRFDGWRSVDAGLVSGDLKAVRPDLPVQFAFQSTVSAPDAIKILLQRATPRLTANGLAMVSVTDVAVVYTLALQWQIDSATTDSLVFTTPSFLAGKLEFTGTGIRETTHVDAGEGRTRWTIWLRTPVSGKYFVAAVATLPPASKEVVAPAIVFEQGNGVTTPVEGQRQYVLLINLSQSQLTSASPELTESVQREDVPVVVDQSLVDQATELVRVKQLSTAPRWTLQTFAQTASVPASVNVADLTTIVSRDGTYRGQAIYTIKNRSRQFLALKMPENAELLSVFVGNVPSRAVTTKRKNDTIQLIALPKTSAASLAFPVRIIWRGRVGSGLPKAARLLRQEVDIAAPIVVSQQDDPDFGIPVARTRWTVWLPDDLDAQPLKASVRNNLTLQSDDAPDLLYQKAAVQELSELLGFVEQNYSYNTRGEGRRAQATNNMKQIGLALDNATHLSQSVGSVNGGDHDFVQQRDVALKRLSDLQKSIQTDQQQLPAIASGIAIDQSGSTVRGIQLNSSFTGNSFFSQAQTELSNVELNSNSLLLSNTGNGLQVNTKSESNEFSFELQNKNAEKAPESTKDGGKPASAKGNVAGQQTRQSLQLGNGVNIDALNNDINAQKQAGQQGQQGQLQQLGRGRMAQPGPMVDGSGPGGGLGYRVTAEPNRANATYPNSGAVTYPQDGQPIAQQPQGGQQGFGGQQGLWMANPVNPQAMGGGFGGGINGQQGGQGGFVGQLGGQFGNVGGSGNLGPGSGPDGPRGYTQYGGFVPGATSSQPQGNRMIPSAGFKGDPNAWVEDSIGLANVNGNLFAQNAGEPVIAGNNPAGGAQMRMPTGGLSLGFDLPTTGKKLVFSKAGGDPKLALAVRPQETVRWGLNLVWSGIWLAIGIGIALAVRSSSMSGRLPQQLLIAIAALSILGFIVLPSPLNGCAFMTFVVVTLIIAWINRRAPETI